MTIKEQLVLEIKKILQGAGIEDTTPKVDYPLDPKHGDYATNVALIAAKRLNRNPIELAEEIAAKLKTDFIERIEVVKPGFINFWIKDIFLQKAFEIKIPQIGKGKKVVVEYSSPNIAKPFTIGHLRSTIIGDAVANLLAATGWEVKRDNHVGDWGTQFGKQIYAIKTWGNEEELEKAERPVKLLVDLYVKFHDEAEKDPTLEDKARAWFKKLEDGDEEAKKLWQKCIDWSWKEFEKIYAELGVAFTENNGRGYGESFFEDKMKPVIKELEDKGLLQIGENGAKLVFFPAADSGQVPDKYPPLMILKKDGATLYSTRDLATDKFRLEHYGSDVKIINEVGAEQALYFRQLYELEKRLGWYQEGQRVHVKHGLYRFKEGKMSTRKGNVIWLEEVLEEAKKKAHGLTAKSHDISFGDTYVETKSKDKTPTLKESEIINNSDIVGIGALKWNDLKRSSEQDINFDWDEILNMQGNSGPYLQYTFARTQSVLDKSEEKTKYKILNTSLQIEERELLRLLARFPEVVEEAAGRLAPNILCTYLFELAQAFNLFYQKCPILKAEDDIRDFRLGLTHKAGEVVKEGLSLLGIQAPKKM